MGNRGKVDSSNTFNNKDMFFSKTPRIAGWIIKHFPNICGRQEFHIRTKDSQDEKEGVEKIFHGN